MEAFILFFQNLLSPGIICFFIGIFSGIIKKKLSLPKIISRYLAFYLIIAIGFKGGIALYEHNSISFIMLQVILAGLLIGLAQPFIGYFLLNLTTTLDKATSAAVAAHYGSISMVTFIASINFLSANNVGYDGYIMIVVALMEVPAIFSGLFLAKHSHAKSMPNLEKSTPKLIKKIFTNGTVVLLFGAFCFGYLNEKAGFTKIENIVVEPFQALLALFLFDMGLTVSREIDHLKVFNLRLVLFGIYMPILGAIIGITTAYLLDLSVGTGMLFVILCASASYIAVPAVMRIALPTAKAGIYVPMSLAITFPFNIVVGIPIYYELAKLILK